MPETNAPGRRREASPIVILALGLVSGAVALAYEVLWTRELLNLLGSTTRASALVLAGFMGGLALGAYAAGRWTVRIGRPLRLFAAAEGALGCIGLVFPYALDYAAREIGIGAILDAALLVLLLGPAFSMGIALPSLASALQHQGAIQPKYVAALYGLNTLGGAAAALGVGLMALPAIGLSASELTVAATGLLLAALAWAMSARTRPSLPTEEASARAAVLDVPRGLLGRTVVLAALILSGVAALGYEVLWTRILVLVVGSSSTAFALMLGFYLLGLALGGFAMSRISGWEGRPARTFQLLQLAIAATALLGAGVYAWLPSVALFGFAQLGTAPASIFAVNVLLVAAIIIPPTVVIGASFPVAARLMEGDRPRRGREVGLALALTTAGNVGGILLAAFAIIPAAGLQNGVAILAVLNALAASVLWLVARRGWTRLRHAVPAIALGVGLAATALPPWDIAVMTSGVFRHAPTYLAMLGGPRGLERAFAAYRTCYYAEGSEAVVAVFDRPTLEGAPHRVLTIDGKVDASTGADMATQVLSGHLPFLFNPDARRALVIGLASGVTAGALAEHDLRAIDIVEIEPAVLEASGRFDELSGAPLDDPRVNVFIGDGRRHLHATRARYDVVVSEPSNPWLSMSARLFTREFFEQVRERLNKHGVLVQWVPLYALGKHHFAALLRTLVSVFPHVNLFQSAEGDLLAIASVKPLEFLPGALDALYDGTGSAGLRNIGFDAREALLAKWIADAAGLRAILGEGPLNTDDNGLLELGTPWYVLQDTAPSNRALVERAAGESRFMVRMVETLLTRGGGQERLQALAARHVSAGRTALVRSLSASLRLRGSDALADLLAGDADAADGRWSEAERAWRRHEGTEFWRRLGRLAFRRGDSHEAVTMLARVPPEARRPEDEMVYALSLQALGRTEDARDVLGRIVTTDLSAPAILGAYLAGELLANTGRPSEARMAHARFGRGVDDLRRCLEADGCRDVLAALLRWAESAPPGLREGAWEDLRQELYVRVLRPMPVYFHGVSQLWLGQHDVARQLLESYLRLLPEPDARSRAHALIAALPPAPLEERTPILSAADSHASRNAIPPGSVAPSSCENLGA